MKDIDVNELLKKLTLEEKVSLLSGKGFWNLQDLPAHGVESIMVTDGPHGLRIQEQGTDHLGIAEAKQATCFPPAVTLASSWNRDLLNRVGQALGEECQEENVSVLLGPGINIKRSPLCGRNFEYYSEDPMLSGELGASFINGVQSQGVGTSLKHFAANNQEYNRMVIDTIADERTLREIYLKGFEIAVKKAQPWTVMCAYNKINGEFASEHPWLLTQVLKEEWGHEGLVVTDWGAINHRDKAVEAGLELEMPTSGGVNDQLVLKAVQSGKLSMESLDAVVRRLLELYKKAWSNHKTGVVYDREEHHQLAQRAAEESMVLLKNDNDALPLKRSDSFTVIGALGETPRFQGAGSSQVRPTKLPKILDELSSYTGRELKYAPGYLLDSDKTDQKLLEEAVNMAKEEDTILLFAGLPPLFESEGFDRNHMRLPDNQLKLIDALGSLGKKLIIVLSNGSPVEMAWLDRCHGLLEAYLGGQAGAGAMVNILFGEVNPSGKLAETFPLKLEDNPSFANFPGQPRQVEYREGLYVGYRYYDTADKEVLFPMGYGLSYTRFDYEAISLSKESWQSDEELKVKVTVKNSGDRDGWEIVQLYVQRPESQIYGPIHQLKAFEKVFIKGGESRDVELVLDREAFQLYHREMGSWQVEGGEYIVQAGSSSRDLPLKTTVKVISPSMEAAPSPQAYLTPTKENFAPSKQDFAQLLGHRVPEPQPLRPFNINSTLEEISVTRKGKKIYNLVFKMAMKSLGSLNDPGMTNMFKHIMRAMPLKNLVFNSNGRFSFNKMETLIDWLNHRGLKWFFRMLFTK